jgi:hypothetical protein
MSSIEPPEVASAPVPVVNPTCGTVTIVWYTEVCESFPVTTWETVSVVQGTLAGGLDGAGVIEPGLTPVGVGIGTRVGTRVMLVGILVIIPGFSGT